MARKIKKSIKKLICSELFLIISFLLNIFVINIKNIYYITGFLIVSIGIILYFLGYEKNRERLRKDSVMNSIIFGFLLHIILYSCGIFLGFQRTPYSLKLLGIIKNIFPLILVITTSEFLRYCINQKGKESKIVTILSCITFIVIDFSIQTLYYDFTDKKEIVEIICLILLPCISKNIFLTYNTKKFGYQSSIIYRLIIELSEFIVPIVPNIGDYLKSVIYFLYPLLIYYITKKTLGKNGKKEEVIASKKQSNISIIITLIIVFVMIYLNSGLFSYFILAIGSGSMEKTVYRGDAVVVHKLNQTGIDKLKVGDILVYKYQNKTVVHRIYKIDRENSNLQIITKGDNNELPDNWVISDENILGKVMFKIKYLGYPTILLNDFLN